MPFSLHTFAPVASGSEKSESRGWVSTIQPGEFSVSRLLELALNLPIRACFLFLTLLSIEQTDTEAEFYEGFW